MAFSGAELTLLALVARHALLRQFWRLTKSGYYPRYLAAKVRVGQGLVFCIRVGHSRRGLIFPLYGAKIRQRGSAMAGMAAGNTLMLAQGKSS